MNFRTLVALFAGIAFVAGPGARPAPAAEPYSIYAILSLTGPLALIGGDQQAALQIVEENVNKAGGIKGRPIHFVIADDQSQPAQAVQLANGIMQKSVPVILGPTYAASCLALLPLVRANGPVLYCLAPAIHPPAGSFTFSTSVSTFDQATTWFNFALSKGWKRLAVLASTDSAGQDGEQQVDLLAANPRYAAISIVDKEHFALGDVSATAQAARLKAASPDAIVVTSVGTGTGIALHALKEAGLEKTPVITNFGNLIHAQLEQYAPFIPDDMYLAAPRFVTYDTSGKGPVRDAQAEFYGSLSAHGIAPDSPHSLAWDPALIVISALRKLGTTTDAKALLAYIESLHGYAGSIGIFDYRDGGQRGVGLSSVVVVKWNAAKKNWVTVSDIGGKVRK